MTVVADKTEDEVSSAEPNANELAEEEEEFESDLEDESDGEDVVGDHDYELTRSEDDIKTASQWKIILMKADFAEDLLEVITRIKPFERCPTTAQIVPTASFNNFVKGVCLFFDCGKKISPKVMRSLSREIFGCCDIFFGISKAIVKSMSKQQFTSATVWWNVFNFLKSVPDPALNVIPRLFKLHYHQLRNKGKRKIIAAFQATWIQLMKCNIPNNVLVVLIPYISDNILGSLNEPNKTVDFFFNAFGKGDMFAILSLDAIFKLIVNHNFEYPNFYDQVYSLAKPSVLYMSHKQKFIQLLDTFLSSTHIPIYIVAGFMKRLCRMLLLAPLDAQEPILGLIRNLVTRHAILVQMLHRELPATVDADPFDEDEPALNKCNAMDSSLWEIKTLQRHWHSSVAKRANFVDKGLQKMESFVRFRCQEEYFSLLMAKRFGKDEDSVDEKYTKMQDGSDDDEPAAKKQKKGAAKKGKFQKKHEAEKEHCVPTNFTTPTGTFFPENSFNLDYANFWTT